MVTTFVPYSGAAEFRGDRVGREVPRGDLPGARFLAENAAHLVGYYFFHTQSRTLAEELVEETLRIAMNPPSTLELDRGSAVAWLYSLAQYVLGRHEGCLSGLQPREQGAGSSVVEDLSRLERELLALKLGGFGDAEIVEITGLRQGHIDTLLERARQKLQPRPCAEGES